ncbi:MAG: glycolate oxidase subunit GlcF [Alphaproteobacteria bacterium]|jgi:glycolate oxidase iron-sulfur subunit|nr:glycolate oxidase iron-sulfur subunit [Rhodospirillaceae bacterium]MDP6023140.1 glycolate oxidase subunit GlcF [Alphaproteobacteria bacterium]MDP6253611.1 glycolate oxidase subunit GlcF [Alphaproteobacteria bacterium]MDP7056208.1 glycolate oxidase subunit GlcF [Alphaproteobacteria bacterium]MDP7227512.1 glycolate oxidase subunit GlcF [Alphaproteobacteria bacterium]|tara:strand:+ start:11073 stop:12356 length:1284 start_codon:yes stop_codon:yes gene_type:complete
MRTDFQTDQLTNPAVAEADGILRKCVHCGFCTATCPTYVLLGDELDSPRGRVYLIKNMLESGQAPDERTVRHIDRCLSCLSCMTTCPSGVDYLHLLDGARARIEAQFQRPLAERLLRALLAKVLPRPVLFRLALQGARLAKPFAAIAPGRLRAMLTMAPGKLPAASNLDRPQVHVAQVPRKMRVAMLTGCAQQVLDPDINAATIRLLTRLGCDVVIAKDVGCCGALTHHMGRESEAMASIRGNVAAWTAELEGEGLDAVVINASGCGTTVKDYGHILADDPNWAGPAKTISDLALDITELLQRLEMPAPRMAQPVKVAYHAACSLQHGQKVVAAPKKLLEQAGFEVMAVPEGHLCCGSAGTYNLLQPELAGKLLERKAGNINSLQPDVVAAGNIGCMVQLGSGLDVPVVHTVELLDWATGGPKPAGL